MVNGRVYIGNYDGTLYRFELEEAPRAIALLHRFPFCISQRDAARLAASNGLDTQFPQNCRRIPRSAKFVAVSQRQTCNKLWKVFDCDPERAYKCAHMLAHVYQEAL